MSNRLCRWFAALSIGVATQGIAQYSIVDLGDLGGGYGRAWAINEAGQVAGDALLPVIGTVGHAVLWQSGSVFDLGTLGGLQSAAYGINNSGVVVGKAQTGAGSYYAPALWNGSTVTALSSLGGNGGTAYGINDAGIAVGSANLASGYSHATLWTGGGTLDLGTLGGTLSVAYDINNQGTVVGAANNGLERNRAALWGESGPVDLGGLSGGQWWTARAINDWGQVVLWGTPMGEEGSRAAFWNGDPASPVMDLGTFGGGESWAYALNDHGYVVGSADLLDATHHAFVWNGVEKTDLGTLGGDYSVAFGINNQGIIVGWADDASTATHAVMWVPIPEPATSILGLLGGGMLGLWARRRRTIEAARW